VAVKVAEGTLFWVLHWAASAMDDDPEQIINYYRAIRELWPQFSTYDQECFRRSYVGISRKLGDKYKSNPIVQHHIGLIWHLVGME
jgi:hypothetical protein